MTVQGVLALFVAAVHGVAALLKGNTPTEGHLLASIGVFTLIPDYLYTGITTLLSAAVLGVWTVGFIHRKHGPAVFLGLAALLFLVGGGVAQVPFLLLTFAVSTRIRTPLTWWEKALPVNARRKLSKAWLPAFLSGYAFLGAGIGIWLMLLPPGVAHAVSALEIACWSFLIVGLVLQVLTIVAGFARDIESRKS